MKNFTLIIILFSFLISQSAFSQKTKLIYFFNGNKIDCKKVEKEKINLKIIYSKPESTNIKKGISPITGSVLDWGISKLLDPLAKAIYNPKNYIYTSKSKYRFITNKKIEIFKPKTIFFQSFYTCSDLFQKASNGLKANKCKVEAPVTKEEVKTEVETK